MKGLDYLMGQNYVEEFREDMSAEYGGLIVNGYNDPWYTHREHGPFVVLKMHSAITHHRLDAWYRRAEKYVSLNLER